MSSHELVERWDAFLARIRQRFDDALVQAEAAVLDSLESGGYDAFASLRAQQSMSQQIEESLIRKIEETWRMQVRPAMEAEGDYWIHQIRKGPNLELELQRDLQIWNTATSGKLAERYYEHLMNMEWQNFCCSQCQSPLTLRPHISRAEYVTCTYCNAVNTFVPETRYAMLPLFVDYLAAYHAIDAFEILTRLRYSAVEANDIGRNSKAYESAARAYGEAFCKARIALVPEKQAEYEADLAITIGRLLPR